MDKKTTSKQDLIKQNKILKRRYDKSKNTIKSLRTFNNPKSLPQRIKSNQIAIKSNQIKELEAKIKQQQLQIKNLKYHIQQQYIYTAIGIQLNRRLGLYDRDKINKTSYIKQSKEDTMITVDSVYDNYRLTSKSKPNIRVTDQKLIKQWAKNTLNYKQNKINRESYMRNSNHMFAVYADECPTEEYYITADDIANVLDKLTSKYVSKHTKTRHYN